MSDSKDDTKDYDVGFKKPPKNTQFKKGQSGNSKGRPKGIKNLKTIWNNQLSKTVSIIEEGKKRKVQKQEAVVTRLINKALLGDIKAIAIVLQLDRQLQSTIDSITLMPIRKPTDEKVQAGFFDRVRESIRAEIEHEKALQSKEIDTPTGETP